MDYEALHLDQNEHVILEVRKHWIVFVGHAIGLLFCAFIPSLLVILIKVLVPQMMSLIPTGINTSALFLFFYSLWLLVLWISFFVDWTKYYLDVWYVTEKRIIAIQQKRIFDREISNLRFDKIQDVTVDIHGFIPTLLKFGNVKVQTASEDNQEFMMNTVRYPDEVRRVIFSQQNQNSQRRMKVEGGEL
jgi:uncharacterized membrane protein YdbT with pleckstrin-like domain